MNNSAAHTALVNDIRLALGRAPDLTLWPFQPASAPDSSGRSYRTGPVGMADLCGILAPTGRWFCLEVKTGRGRLSEDQRLWHSLIQRRGGFATEVRSVEDAEAALLRARRGECK